MIRAPLTRDKKIVVAFDTWALNSVFRNQGTFVYSQQLLGHLRQLAGRSELEIRPFVSFRAKNEANALPPGPGFRPRHSAVLRSSRLWRYGGGWLAMCLGRPDVIFSPSFHTLLFASTAVKVITVHDLTPVVMPNFAPAHIIRKLQFALRRAVKSADGIITISGRSKSDLINVFHVPATKISVVYHGFDSSIFNQAPPQPEFLNALRERFQIRRPYLFHHGLMQPRKNLKRLIEAHRLLTSRNPGCALDLVLAGPLGWRGDEIQESARQVAGSRGDVIFTGPLPDNDLAVLLKGAELTVIPSLYEGFCLPMVESMACGVPTIVASSSCLPEVSGGVLRYFDPESVEQIAGCMQQVLTDRALKTELSVKGLQRAQRFSWIRCAEETAAVLLQSAHEVGRWRVRGEIG